MVLDAALAIAVERGVGAVTIGSVADHLEVTRPVVYGCFGDRVELMQALLQREQTQVNADMLAALHTARAEDPQTAFTDGYRAFLQRVADRPQSWQLIFTASPDHVIAGAIDRSRLAIAAEATRWIRPALARWWATADLDRKLPILIELFISSCEAAVRCLLAPQLDWPVEELAQFYGRVITEAMRAA